MKQGFVAGALCISLCLGASGCVPFQESAQEQLADYGGLLACSNTLHLYGDIALSHGAYFQSAAVGFQQGKTMGVEPNYPAYGRKALAKAEKALEEQMELLEDYGKTARKLGLDGNRLEEAAHSILEVLDGQAEEAAEAVGNYLSSGAAEELKRAEALTREIPGALEEDMAFLKELRTHCFNRVQALCSQMDHRQQDAVFLLDYVWEVDALFDACMAELPLDNALSLDVMTHAEGAAAALEEREESLSQKWERFDALDHEKASTAALKLGAFSATDALMKSQKKTLEQTQVLYGFLRNVSQTGDTLDSLGAIWTGPYSRHDDMHNAMEILLDQCIQTLWQEEAEAGADGGFVP